MVQSLQLGASNQADDQKGMRRLNRLPIIIAIVVGIQAVRNAKKSEEKKHQWQQNGAYADGHEDSRRD